MRASALLDGARLKINDHDLRLDACAAARDMQSFTSHCNIWFGLRFRAPLNKGARYSTTRHSLWSADSLARSSSARRFLYASLLRSAIAAVAIDEARGQLNLKRREVRRQSPKLIFFAFISAKCLA